MNPTKFPYLCLIVAGTVLAVACSAYRAEADSIKVFATGGVQTNTVDTRARHPVGPTGNYSLRATATDNLAVPKTATTGPLVGAYTMPAPAGGVSALPATVAGIKFTPSATPTITWGAGFWDSRGSIATLAPAVVRSPTENAFADAVVLDPATYKFSDFTGSDVVLSLTLDPGLTLAAQGDSETSSSAEIQGNYSTSLLSGSGFLWSFDWSTDSNHPDSSIFTFKSNPALGLDDASIMSSFLSSSGLSESGGIHQLTSAFTISADIPISPGMIGSDGSLSYILGGTVGYSVAGASAGAATPEPSTLCLFGTGAMTMIVYRWRRRKRTKPNQLEEPS